METMPYESRKKQSSLDGLERRSQLGMSSTPIERHQPEHTKNEGPTTTTGSDYYYGEYQPGNLLEEIGGLEGTECVLGTWRPTPTSADEERRANDDDQRQLIDGDRTVSTPDRTNSR